MGQENKSYMETVFLDAVHNRFLAKGIENHFGVIALAVLLGIYATQDYIGTYTAPMWSGWQ